MKKILPLIMMVCLGSGVLHASFPTNTKQNYPIDLPFSFEEANPPEDSDSKFIIFVNDGILNIKYNKPQELINGEVLVFNILGQEITRKKLENNAVNQVTIPVQNTCYIIKINYSGKVHTQKVISTSR